MNLIIRYFCISVRKHITALVWSLYNTPLYNTDLDIIPSCCGSKVFFNMEYDKGIIGKCP